MLLVGCVSSLLPPCTRRSYYLVQEGAAAPIVLLVCWLGEDALVWVLVMGVSVSPTTSEVDCIVHSGMLRETATLECLAGVAVLLVCLLEDRVSCVCICWWKGVSATRRPSGSDRLVCS